MLKFERLARIERTAQPLNFVAKLAGIDASHLWAGYVTPEQDARLIEICEQLERGELAPHVPKFMRSNRTSAASSVDSGVPA
jgi:hypothetical protein